MSAIVTRTAGRLLLGAAVAPTLLVLVGTALIAVFIGRQQASTCGAAAGGPPSATAERTIPADLMPIFRAAQSAYRVPWNVLAAINAVETDFGRNLSVSSAGAIGGMQFMPGTWARYGVDADHDGRKDPYDPADAIFAAANYLRASGALQDLHAAILAYNHAEWYYQQVTAWAHRLAQPATNVIDTACAPDTAGVAGKVQIAPGANLPGRPITAETQAFLARVAGIYGSPLVVTTGTNHSKYTVDGAVSDHFSGHAGDIGMVANGGTNDGPIGDAIATACLIAAGDPPARARQEAAHGGLFPREHHGLRIQCIWKTDAGGNHHGHVHIGARPTTTELTA